MLPARAAGSEPPLRPIESKASTIPATVPKRPSIVAPWAITERYPIKVIVPRFSRTTKSAMASSTLPRPKDSASVASTFRYELVTRRPRKEVSCAAASMALRTRTSDMNPMIWSCRFFGINFRRPSCKARKTERAIIHTERRPMGSMKIPPPMIMSIKVVFLGASSAAPSAATGAAAAGAAASWLHPSSGAIEATKTKRPNVRIQR